jgi:hypothetical protein
MTTHEKVTAIINKKASKRDKIADILSLIGDDRRDFIYRELETQKASGKAWLEDMKKTARHAAEHSEFGDEKEEEQVQ